MTPLVCALMVAKDLKWRQNILWTGQCAAQTHQQLRRRLSARVGFGMCLLPVRNLSVALLHEGGIPQQQHIISIDHQDKVVLMATSTSDKGKSKHDNHNELHI